MAVEVELQKAIYTALTAALAVPVYDEVPQHETADDLSFPFVVIGDNSLAAFDDDVKNGFEATVTVHSWSRYRGRLEIKQLQGQIYNALHRNDDLTIAAPFEVFGSSFESSTSLMEPDGVTRHGVQDFRIFITESPYLPGQC